MANKGAAKLKAYTDAVFRTAKVQKLAEEIDDLTKEKRAEIAKNKRAWKATNSGKDFTGRGMDGTGKRKRTTKGKGKGRSKGKK